MKKYIYPLLVVAALTATTSCNDSEVQEIVEIIPDSQKEMVKFSISDDTNSQSLTRAGFTGGTSNNLNTRIAACFVSTKGSSTDTRMTRTLLYAKPETSSTTGYSEVIYLTEDYNRYWDDAFGREGRISVYAIAVPNKADAVTNNSVTLDNKLDFTGTVVNTVSNPNWRTGLETTNTVQWTVTNGTQSTATIENEDLCYSNNIQENTSLGKKGRRVWGTHGVTNAYPDFVYELNGTLYPNCDDGVLSFALENTSQTDGPGHFDYGHMIFNHALSRLTIELYAGEGFNMDATTKPFDFATGTNIKLLSMPVNGTLNLKAGAWAALATANYSDIALMSCSSKSTTVTNSNKAGTPVYELTAQMLPGYVFADASSDNVMTFTIDGNAYYVTKDQVYDALNQTENQRADYGYDASGNKFTMMQGKNYKLKITVGKTAIKALTATLVDWVDVAGSFEAKNAYITFSSLTAGNSDKTDCTHFDLYRVLNESSTVTTPTNTTFSGTPQYMTGYASNSTPVADKLSTEGTSAGVTKASDYSTSKKFETSWFFENNKSFYHFRTVLPGTAITKEANSGDGDTFKMYSGAAKDWKEDGTATENSISTAVNDGKVNDYHWGAIFKSDAGNLAYNVSSGFNTQLAGPVGPTLSTLNIIEQHMMSNIRIILLTPVTKEDGTTAATDMVDLFDNSTSAARGISEINLTNYSGSATVKMGNGLITPTTSYTAASTITAPAYTQEGTGSNADGDYCHSKSFQFNSTGKKYYESQPYTWRVVPQELVVTDNTTTPATVSNRVGITIQTPDDNMYYVVEDLSQIEVSSVTGNSLKTDHRAGEKITRWYPGYTYTYYFVITKTGIKALTCTIVDWVTVNAKPIDINLES